MIGYVTLGSNDLDRAKTFYDGVLAGLGARRGYSGDRMQFWITEGGAPMLSLCRPFDGEPASVGNGAMVALPAETLEIVDAVHATAIALGATDEGAPGQRLDWFYGGYFRDPDGNKDLRVQAHRPGGVITVIAGQFTATIGRGPWCGRRGGGCAARARMATDAR